MRDELLVTALTVVGKDAIIQSVNEFEKESLFKRKKFEEQYTHKIMWDNTLKFSIRVSDVRKKFIKDDLSKKRMFTLKHSAFESIIEMNIMLVQQDYIRTLKKNGASINIDYKMELINNE